MTVDRGEQRYPVALILKHRALTIKQKAMLLALVAVYSFDAEGKCAFQRQSWENIRLHLGIEPNKASRYWANFLDAGVIVPADDRNAPFPYYLLNAQALDAMEALYEQQGH